MAGRCLCGGSNAASGLRSWGAQCKWQRSYVKPAPDRSVSARSAEAPARVRDARPSEFKSGGGGRRGSGQRSSKKSAKQELNPARLIALKQLQRIEEDAAFASRLEAPTAAAQEALEETDGAHTELDVHNQVAALDAVLRRADEGARTKRATTLLVGGVTRWRRQLDVIIAAMSKRSPGTLDAGVRQILRLGTFEIVHKDLAAHAISEHVELAKLLCGEHTVGFVNGVLRNLIRRREAGTLPVPEIPLGDIPDERQARKLYIRQMAIALSHPSWMVQRWLDAFGVERTIALCHHNNKIPTYGVRILDRRANRDSIAAELDRAGVEVALSELSPDFLRVSRNMQHVVYSDLMKRGAISVQDEAAGLVVSMLDPQPGEIVLDACAAPGGKAVGSALRMRSTEGTGDEGALIAMDVHAPRLELVRSAAHLAGVSGIVRTFAADLRTATCPEGVQLPKGLMNSLPSSSAQGDSRSLQCDRVLLDAPCSGTGVLSKRADMRWQRPGKSISELVDLQRELLVAAAHCVKPGGFLVYSTCSIEAEENQAQIEWFLEQMPMFELDPHGCAQLPTQVVTTSKHMQCLPFLHGTDGAFAARMKRKQAL